MNGQTHDGEGGMIYRKLLVFGLGGGCCCCSASYTGKKGPMITTTRTQDVFALTCTKKQSAMEKQMQSVGQQREFTPR